ncbi:hypothetical protein ITJ57_08285 [Plantibacter sp. VKM Ac-2880]|uniref:hypothetical protein n=1 Tax=Plantibacter sp. VKM Ac-2880 TaxID=2783827 RepID=UPI00188E5C9E|nr:hypothetical protein [Plantibacter sp. VKM Ac-2880]MBF4568768.1 hypothetical protein [Plantibacter sp. VKM Ac-2880]
MEHIVAGTLDALSVTELSESFDDLHLNLERVRFATPEGIVAMVTKLEKIARSGTSVLVSAPTSDNVSNYLARAHVPHILDGLDIRHGFGSVREWHQGNQLIELQMFSSSSEVHALATSVHAFAEPHGADIAAQLFSAVCEAGENVSFHAETTHGYVMAQYFPNRGDFGFAIGDSGVGFLGSLSRIGATDHDSALAMAVAPGVSATGERNRGYGLSSIRDNVSGLGGSFKIFGGNRKLSFGSGCAPTGSKGAFVGVQAGSLVSCVLPTRRA